MHLEVVSLGEARGMFVNGGCAVKDDSEVFLLLFVCLFFA